MAYDYDGLEELFDRGAYHKSRRFDLRRIIEPTSKNSAKPKLMLSLPKFTARSLSKEASVPAIDKKNPKLIQPAISEILLNVGHEIAEEAIDRIRCEAQIWERNHTLFPNTLAAARTQNN